MDHVNGGHKNSREDASWCEFLAGAGVGYEADCCGDLRDMSLREGRDVHGLKCDLGELDGRKWKSIKVMFARGEVGSLGRQPEDGPTRSRKPSLD